MRHTQLGIAIGMTTTAVILAGGLGTRLRDTVPDLPKPMAPINGRPFLEYQFDYWIAQGICRFILSVGYRSVNIAGYFGNSYRNAAIEYVVEKEPLGTGGGLLLAVEKLAYLTPFLLLNGDTFFEVNFDELLAFQTETQADFVFSLFRANEAGRYMGIEVDTDGRICSLKSGTGIPGRLANGGVYLVSPMALKGLPFIPGDKASLEDDIMPALQSTGFRLFGLECKGRFIDIGVPQDYFRAAEILT